MTLDVRHRLPAHRLVLLVLVGMALVLAAAQPARADIRGGDFPRASQVKASMHGKGAWERALGDPDFKALGAKPAACRSDRPFRAAKEFRNAYYYGAVKGTKKYHGIAELTTYRFGSTKAARQAMTRLDKFLTACPTSVEWVCQDCDGVWTYHRAPAVHRPLGDQSVTWNERKVGMGVAKGHAIAARTGRIVVVTVVSHQTDPDRMKTPRAPTWKRTMSVARKALVKAS